MKRSAGLTRVAFLFAYGLVLGWFGARLVRGLINFNRNDLWLGIVGVAALGIIACFHIAKTKRPKANGGTDR